MPGIRDLLGGDAPRTPLNNNVRTFGNEEVVIENKKCLKINNAKSKIKPPPERIDVTANAQQILSDMEFQNRIGWNLTSRLLSIFKDKKLQENKSEADKNKEMQVLADYVEFAKLVNNNQTQEEGLGSVVFSLAVVKCALLQRDEINEQGKMLDILKRKVSVLEASINSKNK